MASPKRWGTMFWCVGLAMVTSVGVSLWTTSTVADIVITGDDWDKFRGLVELPSAGELIKVPTTADGRKSLHFTLPFEDKYALYALNVTQLPAGRTRFPVQLEARMVTRRETGLGIRNLSLDAEPDLSLQKSFIAVGLSERGRSSAQDDLGETDVDGTIGSAGERGGDPTVDTTITPAGTITTLNATLELRLGINLLRLDTTQPEDLPLYNPQSGYQLFTLTIGPGEDDLQGELVATCTVRRQVSPELYASGEKVTVMLTARNVAGATTITETFPDTWTVANAGGGSVAGNTIAFDLDAGGSVTYELNVSDDFCEVAEIRGTFAGNCGGSVIGSSRVGCLRKGGIRITGSDWSRFTNPESAPDVVTTADGRVSLDMNDGGSFAIYSLTVTKLPAGKERFPVLILSRQVDDNSSSMAIRNLTIDPEPDPAIQDSFIAIRLMDNGDAEARDERWQSGVEGEDPRDTTGRSGTRRDGADKSTLVYPEDLTRTTLATIKLQEGENLLRIDCTDVRDLPEYDSHEGHQLFEIVIGPDEPELQGTLACQVVREISPDSYPPGRPKPISVTLTATKMNGAITITEIFPQDYTVLDAGGSTVNGNEMAFNLTQDGEVTYKLTPGGPCETVELSGAVTGTCSTSVTGEAQVRCSEPFEGVLQFDVGCGPVEPGWFPMDTCGEYLDVDGSGLDVTIETNDCDCRGPYSALGMDLPDVEADLLFSDSDTKCSPFTDFYVTLSGLTEGAEYTLISYHTRGDEQNPSYIEGVELTGSDDWELGVEDDDPDDGRILQNAQIMDSPAELSFTADESVVEIRYISGCGTSPEQVIMNGFELIAEGGVGKPTFHRGDADDNGALELTDAIRILGFLFLGGAAPTCLDAADADNNSELQLTDAIRILGFLFLGGPPPVHPGPPEVGAVCGTDDDEALGCVSYTKC